MADAPTGTVTLLFTDIEGSTRLLHDLGARYAATLDAYRHGGRGTVVHRDCSIAQWYMELNHDRASGGLRGGFRRA